MTLRVGMLGPVTWRTPPDDYGPWERVTSLLTEGLVRRGVEVTLFATADSVTEARLDPVVPHGYASDPSMDGRVWEALHVAHAMTRSAEVDIVHNQLDWLPLAFGAQWRAPMLTTIHGFSGAATLPVYESASSAFVSISDSDRSPKLDYIATVHHGIDPAELPVVLSPDDYLVCFGRIHPDKGTAQAIKIARRAGRRLVICGIVHDQEYFASEVAPHIDGNRVEFRGSVGATDRAHILGNAAALLHPIAFNEPCGLSVVEAMMCGTPVIAYRRGSMSEVVDDGITGRTVATLEQAVSAVDEIVTLDRRQVHERAAARFGVERMVDDYLSVYEQILAAQPRPVHS